MKINTNLVSLRISAGRLAQFPRDPIPQIAFSGRSNVGKSSLINTLLGRKSMARVSSTPGKTITINFYDVDKSLFLVDLPGYGYAQRGGDNKREWSKLTDAYFTQNPNRDLLKLVVQLVDARVGLTKDDVMMIEWMLDNQIPFIIVATKVDKLSNPKLAEAMNNILEALNGTPVKIVPFSSLSKVGKNELWNEILDAISAEGQE